MMDLFMREDSEFRGKGRRVVSPLMLKIGNKVVEGKVSSL